MTSAQVVETSVTNNSSFQSYSHLDDHTSGFKPFTFNYNLMSLTCLPPGIHYWTSFLPNNIIVPVPRLGIDWFTHCELTENNTDTVLSVPPCTHPISDRAECSVRGLVVSQLSQRQTPSGLVPSVLERFLAYTEFRYSTGND